MIIISYLLISAYSSYLSYLDVKGLSYTRINFILGGLLLGALINRILNHLEKWLGVNNA